MPGSDKQPPIPLDASLDANLIAIRAAVSGSADIIIREFRAGASASAKAALIYVEGLCDSATIEDHILRPLLRADDQAADFARELPQYARSHILTVGEIKEVGDQAALFESFLSGASVLLFDGFAQALALDTRGWEQRGIEEPSTQMVLRGPKEGFTETLKTNIGLLRRKIKTTQLRSERMTIGRLSRTDVAIMYVEGTADPSVLSELRVRLSRIDIDTILESGNIEEFIQDDRMTYFPTVFNTERPDVAAAGLAEGRVAILVDGTPFVLLVPALLTQFLQSPDDYYQRADIASILRLLRLTAFFIALLAPSVFIAITSFHQEMLPSTLLISIAASRTGVPFPVFVEAMVMEMTFELLREAGLRMPKAVGQAISIVGALVLGEAAVQAGLVSPGMVIVVSLTAITTFAIPYTSLATPIRILRFLMMGLAAMFGLYGIFIGVTYLIIHLNTLSSFGVPYLKPYAPFVLNDQKDGVILRVPIWKMVLRPFSIPVRNRTRQRSPQSQGEE